MREAERQPWRARVLGPRGPVGAGFLVDARHVVTCAHVVAAALDVPDDGPRPEGIVLVDLPGLVEQLPARVREDGWVPVIGERGDVAVLVLEIELLADVGWAPAPLRRPTNMWGNGFRCYGFPRGVPDGVWAHGQLRGPGGPGGEWVQLEGVQVTGRRVEGGFSGAAVYDVEAGGVVGMVVAEDQLAEAKVAWMLPIEVLARAWPPLADLVPNRLWLDPEFRRHWEPRGRGVERHIQAGWYFTGRSRVLRDLVGWLHAPPGTDPKARVVTGGPGSGKSAVLARLVTLTDPTYRAELPPDILADAPAGTVPEPGTINVAVHAAGKTAAQVVAAIAEGTEISANSPEGLVDELLDRGGPLTLVVDALDEARQAPPLVRSLIQPLAEHGGAVGLRLLIGTRRQLVKLLRVGTRVLDLDTPVYYERADLVGYVQRLLLTGGLLSGATPYHADPALAGMVAEAVAARAHPSFLIGQLVARDLAERPETADTDQPGWQEQFPDTVAAAMDRYLARFGPEEQRVSDLLLPLGWAQGVGLDDDGVWADLATALGTARYADHDVRWLRDTTIGTLLQATELEDSVAYRLFHEALAEHLRTMRPERDAHRAYTHALLQRIPLRDDGRTRIWSAASDYARAHLSTHAAGASRLDELLVDPGFLLTADQERLLQALPSARTGEGRAVRRVLRQSSHQLLTASADERVSYLDLAARQHGLGWLADRIEQFEMTRSWSVPWANWQPEREHQLLGKVSKPSGPLVISQVDRRPVLMTIDGGQVRAWSLSTGNELAESLIDEEGPFERIAVGVLHEWPVLLSCTSAGKIQIWDLKHRTAISPPIRSQGARALAVATLDGRPIVLCGAKDGDVRIWNLDEADREPRRLVGRGGAVDTVAVLRSNRTELVVAAGVDGVIQVWDSIDRPARSTRFVAGDEEVRALALGQCDNEPILAAGCTDGTVRLWNVADAQPAHDAPQEKDFPVYAVALGELHERPVVVSGSLNGIVRVWDIRAGRALVEPMEVTQVAIHDAAVCGVDSQPTIVTRGLDGTLVAWDMTDLQSAEQPPIQSPSALASGEVRGRAVVVGHFEHRAVGAWDLRTGEPVDLSPSRLPDIPKTIGTLPDGRIVAWTSDSGSRFATTLRELAHWQAVGPSLPWQEYDHFPATIGQVGGRPVAAGRFEDTIAVFDVYTGESIRPPIEGSLISTCMAVGEFGNRVVIASSNIAPGIQVWDYYRDEPIDELGKDDDPSDYPTAIVIGRFAGRDAVIAGSWFEQLRLWSPGEVRGRRIRVGAPVKSLALTPSGMLIVATGLGIVALQPSTSFWD
jgi:WD40 repeat protein